MEAPAEAPVEPAAVLPVADPVVPDEPDALPADPDVPDVEPLPVVAEPDADAPDVAPVVPVPAAELPVAPPSRLPVISTRCPTYCFRSSSRSPVSSYDLPAVLELEPCIDECPDPLPAMLPVPDPVLPAVLPDALPGVLPDVLPGVLPDVPVLGLPLPEVDDGDAVLPELMDDELPDPSAALTSRNSSLLAPGCCCTQPTSVIDLSVLPMER